MSSPIRFLLALALSLLPLACASAPADEAPQAQPRESESAATPSRRFEIVYTAKVSDLEGGDALRLWIPVPSSGPHQEIGEVKVEVAGGEGLTHRFAEESAWGNRLLYVAGPSEGSEVSVTLRYEVERRPRAEDLQALPREPLSPEARARGLAPGRLVVVDERIKREASALTGSSPLELAESAYDHVALQMVYDKSGEGWGRGDSLYACEVGKGNCTDYHAYFMALCAAREIPTRFEIGLFGPYEEQPGETLKLGGYHCWAEFYAGSWVCVDISEGDKKGLRFLGVQTPNRVTLSRGRDLVLEPAQKGEPLNYFLNPYAEVSGKVHGSVSKSATWRDLP